MSSKPDGYHCDRCAIDYPNIGGIECLMVQPAAFLNKCLGRLERYLGVAGESAARLLGEADVAGLPGSSRRRLLRLANGLDQEQASLLDLFAPVAAALAKLPQAPLVATLFEDPLTLTAYGEHVFRDWVWGADENRRTLALLEPLLTQPVPKVAVFGAGTARLALDLAQHRSIGEVFALDLNPAPLLVTDRLLSGGALELTEFPLVPISADHAAITRRLEASDPAPTNLRLLLADALNIPFEDGSLDAVVTPWFIDAVSADLRKVCLAVNRALRPGGLWLNVGPLLFSQGRQGAYSIEEVHELVRQHGFALEHQTESDLVYFDSPVSATRRIDRIHVFGARKVALAVDNVAAPNASWLQDPTRPVPLTPALAARLQSCVLTVGVASLVDGQRSLLEIAGLLARNWNVEVAEMVGPLGTLIANISPP